MAKREYAIDRLTRFSRMKSVKNAGRADLGLRFSVEELLQLLTTLTGKRALLVNEPQGPLPSLDGAELILATPGQSEAVAYRMTVANVSAEDLGMDNENNDPNSRFNRTLFPKPTGVVILVGKEKPAMALTVDCYPIAGPDNAPPRGRPVPDWGFITYDRRHGYSFSDGGGGTGSKTPPPGS